MRLGVFGGTFDPIHLGHLRAAEWAKEAHALDEVRLVPARRSPFKPEPEASAEDRFRMCELATFRTRGLIVDRAEVDRDGPSYTIDTLRKLRDESPEAELILVVGSDSAKGLRLWKDADDILRLATVIEIPRPGDAPPASGFMGLRISSSEIRSAVRERRSIRFLVPDAVLNYVDGRGLYS